MKSKYGHRTINWFEAIVNKLGGEEAAEKFLRDELVVQPKLVVKTKQEFFSLLVNYDLSIKELMAVGNYFNGEKELTDKNFPTTQSGQKVLEFKIFNFGRINTKEAKKRMDKCGYRPADIRELLAFCIKHPEKLRKSSIVALGSALPFSKGNNVPCFGGFAGHWTVGLTIDGDGINWTEGWDDEVFLAVRK